MEDKSFFQHLVSSIKEYVALAVGFILVILRWHHNRISNLEKKVEEKFVSKEVFEEYRKGLFDRIDRLERNLKEEIKEIKEKLK